MISPGNPPTVAQVHSISDLACVRLPTSFARTPLDGPSRFARTPLGSITFLTAHLSLTRPLSRSRETGAIPLASVWPARFGLAPIARGCLFAIACAANLASAQAIQKCVTPDGAVTYQNAPCDAGSKVVGQVQRDMRSPDPLSLQRADAERRLSELQAQHRELVERARQQFYEQLDTAEERRKERAAAEDRADERARIIAGQQGVYLAPQPIVIRETINIRNPSSAPAAPVPAPRATCTGTGCVK